MFEYGDAIERKVDKNAQGFNIEHTKINTAAAGGMVNAAGPGATINVTHHHHSTAPPGDIEKDIIGPYS